MEVREIINDVEVDSHHQHYLESQTQLQSIFRTGFLFSTPNKLHLINDKKIRFILPLSGRQIVFERFLKNYEQVCLKFEDKTELFIVLYPHKSENCMESIINLIEATKIKYQNSKIEFFQATGNFSRARALDFGVQQSKANDLLFFIDVDIVFTSSALERIRLNTINKKKVYFPIVFSQFDPKFIPGKANNNHFNQDLFTINELNGYWRQFGFGIVSLFKNDYIKIGGFELSINGWGKEDVDFFEKAVKSDLEVFRAPDENLIHVYHKVECDEKLSGAQLSMCKGTRYETLGSVQTLAKIIYNHPEYVRIDRRKLRSNAASAG